MFRIKICGVTTVEDALSAVQAGADAVGLNFFPGSPRFVSQKMAAGVVQALADRVALGTATAGSAVEVVGVFVNLPLKDLCPLVRDLGLRWIQLHGHEPPRYVAELLDQLGPGVQVIRAFRPVKVEDVVQMAEYVNDCRQLGAELAGVLVDAASSRGLGGTGELAAWEVAAKSREIMAQFVLSDFYQHSGSEGEILFQGPSQRLGIPAASSKPGSRSGPGSIPPLILAGGLTPANVEEAIRIVRPDGVDTASGVESSPGRKDPEKILAFVRAAQKGFAALVR